MASADVLSLPLNHSTSTQTKIKSGHNAGLLNGHANGSTINRHSEPSVLSQTPPALQPPNTSLQVTAEHTIKLVKNTPIPQPGPNDVLIHVKATGICGSDIHFWKKGCIGDLSVDGDCILGHEAAGIVLQVGSEVSGLVSGDRVAIEPGVPCGSCFLCSEGRYNLCEDVAFAGVYPYAGTAHASGHASGHVHPATWVHKLPDNITYEQGALLEPLSVVMHGITSCGTSLLGKAVAIHGAGPIGLIALSAARASGASPIVITDLEPKRLAFAKTLVPSCKTYLVQRDLSSKENADRIRSLFGVASSNLARGMYKNEYSAPATVLECTGVESSIVTAIYTCRRGGTVMVIGVGRETMNNFPFMHISLTEINLKCINRYRDTWPSGIAALSGNVLNLDPLITHRFPLDQAVEAMHLASDPSKGSIKVQIADDLDVGPISNC